MEEFIDINKILNDNLSIKYNVLSEMYSYGAINTILTQIQLNPITSYILLNNAKYLSDVKRNEQFEKFFLSYLDKFLSPLLNLSTRDLNTKVMDFNAHLHLICNNIVFKLDNLKYILANFKKDTPKVQELIKDLEEHTLYFIDNHFLYKTVIKSQTPEMHTFVLQSFEDLKIKVEEPIFPAIFYSTKYYVFEDSLNEIKDYQNKYNLPKALIDDITQEISQYAPSRARDISFCSLYQFTKNYTYLSLKEILVQLLVRINLACEYLKSNQQDKAFNLIRNELPKFYPLGDISRLKQILPKHKTWLKLDFFFAEIEQGLSILLNDSKLDYNTAKEILFSFHLYHNFDFVHREDLRIDAFDANPAKFIDDMPYWSYEFIFANYDHVIEKLNKAQILTLHQQLQKALFNERGLIFMKKASFSPQSTKKLKTLLQNLKNLPELKDQIFTTDFDEMLNSAEFIVEYAQKTKSNKAIKEFLKFANETALYSLLDSRKSHYIRNQLNNKLKQEVFKTHFAENIKELEEKYSNLAKQKIAEFKEKVKFNYNKYIEIFEQNMNSRYNEYNIYCDNDTFWKTFNRIIKSYPQEDIRIVFASNEYYYYQLNNITEGAELTPLIVCMIKAIEQYMCCVINYAVNNNLTSSPYIKTDRGTFHIKNDIINKNNNWEKTKVSCYELQDYLAQHVINYSKNHKSFSKDIIEELPDWVDSVRNSHMHKDNVYDILEIKEYIEKSYKIIKLLTMIFGK